MGEKGNATDLGEEILVSLAGQAAQFVSDYQQYEEAKAKRSANTGEEHAEGSPGTQPDSLPPSAPAPLAQA